jgi:hypothetical protein
MLDRQWDAVAWNPQAAQLFACWLPPRPQSHSRPNLLRYMFLDAPARELIVDWPERARRLVAEFRADIGRHASEQPLAGLIAELSAASGTFAELWTLQDVVGREGGLRRFRHPLQGELSFNQVTLHPAKRHDLKLVMLLPQT